jgi:hypothetical protein
MFGHAKTNTRNVRALDIEVHQRFRSSNMNFSSRITSILVVAVLGLASLTLLTSAWGDSGGDRPVQAAWSGAGNGPGGHGDATPWHGHHGMMWRCDAQRDGQGFMHNRQGWHHGPHGLAQKLSAVETEIGIRTNQLDAWRDFTDALLATAQRPSPPSGSAQDADDKAQPFALAQRLADNAIARAKSAQDLLKAIDALRSKLTPDQLAKVTELEAKFRGHHGQHFDAPTPGPHPDAPGPDGNDDGEHL